MENMVERVARRIWNIRREEEDRCDMELEDMGEDHSVWEKARAAIKEMRNVDEGSPAVLKAGMQSLYSCSSDPELDDARGCWQSMIDAALTDAP